MGSNSTDNCGANPSGKAKRQNCIDMLNLVLDGEATEEQKAEFEKHIELCMPCYQNYQLDTMIKQLIKKTCCGKKVPQDMVEAIRSKVLQQAE